MKTAATRRALAWAALVLLGFGSLALASATAPAAAASQACQFTQQSDDAVNASLNATRQGNHVAALRYAAQAQALDEQVARGAGSARLRAACYSSLLVSGAALVRNEMRYGKSSDAWGYARHLAAIWQRYHGYGLSSTEQADYDDFFNYITQALRACPGPCAVSDQAVAQTKRELLGRS